MFWQLLTPFLSGAVGMAIVGSLWMFWAQNYLAKYLAKKAENLATHQDIQKLVDQVRETERVKSEIADRMWDRQRRWDTKKDLYIKIYASLPKLHAQLINFTEVRKAVAAQVVSDDSAPVREAREQLQASFDEYGDVGFVAPLFFSDVALARVTDIGEQAKRWIQLLAGHDFLAIVREGKWEGIKTDLSQHFHEAIIGFSAAARDDLGYPPSHQTLRR